MYVKTSVEDTENRRYTVYKMKLKQGYTAAEIAEATDCNRTLVYRYISRLQGVNVEGIEPAETLPKNAADIAVCASRNIGLPAEEIAAKAGCSVNELAAVVNRVTAHTHFKKSPQSSLNDPYKAITRWRRKNDVSISELAEKCGVSGRFLAKILAGERYMNYEIAEAISKETGLTFWDIYRDIIPQAKLPKQEK